MNPDTKVGVRAAIAIAIVTDARMRQGLPNQEIVAAHVRIAAAAVLSAMTADQPATRAGKPNGSTGIVGRPSPPRRPFCPWR